MLTCVVNATADISSDIDSNSRQCDDDVINDNKEDAKAADISESHSQYQPQQSIPRQSTATGHHNRRLTSDRPLAVSSSSLTFVHFYA